MIAWKALNDLIQVLREVSPNVVPAEHIGFKRPTRAEELPAIVLGSSDIEESSVGIGRLVVSLPTPPEAWAETTGRKASGLVIIELWAPGDAKVREMAEAIFEKLRTAEGGMRRAGFLSFRGREIRPMEELPLGPSTDAPRALRMTLTYAMDYEGTETETVGPDGIIRRVHADLRDKFKDVDSRDKFREEMDIR